MKKLLLIGVAAVALFAFAAPALAKGSPNVGGAITVTPGVDSRHFTVSGCGFRPDRPQDVRANYYVFAQGPTDEPLDQQLSGIVADFPVGANGCGNAVVVMAAEFPTGATLIFVTSRHAYPDPVSTVLTVGLD